MEFFGHFIGGEEVPSIDGEEMLDIDPYSRQPWARVALGSSADAERAVAAAREAFDSGESDRNGLGHGDQAVELLPPYAYGDVGISDPESASESSGSMVSASTPFSSLSSVDSMSKKSDAATPRTSSSTSM